MAARYMTALGVSLVRVGPGLCESVLAVRPEHTQQNGFVHAGVTAAMGDHTAGGAAATLARENHGVLTAVANRSSRASASRSEGISGADQGRPRAGPVSRIPAVQLGRLEDRYRASEELQLP